MSDNKALPIQQKIIQQEIIILKRFKQAHPWTGTYEQKKAKFTLLLRQLCELYKVRVPKLCIPKNKSKVKWAKKWFGRCVTRRRTSKCKILVRNFSHVLSFERINPKTLLYLCDYNYL